MKVYAVKLDFSTLDHDLYDRALASPLLDDESRTRVRRFFRREDAWRCLVGRLLPFYALRHTGIVPSSIHISRTESGKPFIATGAPGFTFNVSHDSNLVVLAHDDDASSAVGIDVMRCALPNGETLQSFVHILSEQLTPLERASILAAPFAQSAPERPDAVIRLFQLWTLKEAYTKALGFGLGFDFARVEYALDAAYVSIDSGLTSLAGWAFDETRLDVQGHPYAIVVARSGVVGAAGGDVKRWAAPEDLIALLDARTVLEQVVQES
ncbi:hypothetical protein BKA62DRAFT_680810 [Auriculariales sp. MPI-PUGE-AT-0066]|nr:hypothetical protein BKA62DRAFT_680810 [Auriculariales sp. MPI-PUGE-AT-0066]